MLSGVGEYYLPKNFRGRFKASAIINISIQKGRVLP